MLFFQWCFGVLALFALVAAAEEEPAEENDNCDGYVDEVPHLQPFNGDCSGLQVDSNAKNSILHGCSWVVYLDSHDASRPTTCEVIAFRIGNGQLRTTETVNKLNDTVVLHEEMNVDSDQEGVFRGEDEVGMVFHTCGEYAMCFAECGKLEEPQDGKEYGAHVFCAVKRGHHNHVENLDQCFSEAETHINEMGLDVTLKEMKTECRGFTHEQYEATGCHKYMDVVPHHEPFSGNCEGLKPLIDFDPAELNGKSYVVQTDSHFVSNTDTCETFEAEYDSDTKTLHTHEIVEKGSGDNKLDLHLHEEMQATSGINGYVFQGSDEMAVFLYASENRDMVVFAECGKLDEPVDGKEYGTHVFCATTNGEMTQEQEEACKQAEEKVNGMGIDVTLKPMKSYCGTGHDDD